MTGVLPYVRVGDKSDLGSAVAELTGIRPLKDLVEHAKKSQAKLRGELRRDRMREIEQLDKVFESERKELTELLRKHARIAIDSELPNPSSRECEVELLGVEGNLERMQAEILVGARKVLGESFDANDTEARADLVDNIGPAIGAVDPKAIGRLPSAQRLHAMGALADEDLGRAEELMSGLVTQAGELERLEEQQDLAARLRLYARVAAWLKEEVGDSVSSISICPLCDADLRGRSDSVTGVSIIEHLEQCLESDRNHLQLTMENWAELACNRLAGELPDELARELRKDLPSTPTDLITQALCEELFRSKAFSGTLGSLKDSVIQLCAKHLPTPESFVEPPEVSLPTALESTELPQYIRRLRRGVAFARWRRDNRESCAVAVKAIVGTADTIADAAHLDGPRLEASPLQTRLYVLDHLVQNSEPLRTALTRIGKMKECVETRREKQDRLDTYALAEEAIKELLPLGDLVDGQVGMLMSSLSEETASWKEALYSPAYKDAPRVTQADVHKDGSLVVDAELEGTRAAAQHVCNASDIRATLLALLFAFWKHLKTTQGSLSLLLLDDLQELFDPQNRRRVANAISRLADDGATVILTTNDHGFARRVKDAATPRGTERTVHRQLLPAKPIGKRIVLSKLLEEVRRKRNLFVRETDNHQAAIDYLRELRVYVEGRLLDFFDIPDSRMPDKPTLSDLLNGIQRRVNEGQEAFADPVFQRLLSEPALDRDGELIRLMNESHHGDAASITYNEVFEIRDNSKRAEELVDSAHDAYERWLRRDPVEPGPPRPKPRVTGRDLSFSVPQIDVLAASVADSPLWDVVESDEPCSCDWLVDHAIYINTTDNLGFAGQKNCRLIVDLSNREPEDKSWVVAIHDENLYVRRLLLPDGRPGQVALVAETSNPLNRPPTLLLPLTEVSVMKIVGVLFDDTPRFPRPKNEADLDEHCDLLGRAEIAFKVRGESALPLVIEKQIILGGRDATPAELSSLEGGLAAIATSAGCAFKRVGKMLPGVGHVRQFESIGGLGESLVARVEALDDDPFGNLPVLESIREIVGVLYPPD